MTDAKSVPSGKKNPAAKKKAAARKPRRTKKTDAQAASSQSQSPPKRKPGRPKKDIDEAMVQKVQMLAAQGMINEEMADCLDMARSTFQLRLNEYPELTDAIQRGRSKGVATATNKLLEKVKAGDLGAIKYYLNNRSAGSWKEGYRIDANVRTMPTDYDSMDEPQLLEALAALRESLGSHGIH